MSSEFIWLKVQWWALVNAILNHQFRSRQQIPWPAKLLPGSQGLYSIVSFHFNVCVCLFSHGHLANGSKYSAVKLFILLHVHPLLGKVLVNKFLWRQILGKQSVARLRNNSDNRRSIFYIVRAATIAMQWFGKHVSTIEAVLSAWSMPKIYRGQWRSFAGVIAKKPWVKDKKPSQKGVVRIQLWSVKRHWRLYVLYLY
jgi:hypothetical protein